LFLDTSVLLSACGSERGASREIFRLAAAKNWTLIVTPYVVREVLKNLDKLPAEASAAWTQLRALLLVLDDVLTLDRPTLFKAGKDRPILFGALAWADVLLTLDSADFAGILGGEVLRSAGLQARGFSPT
jgi:predicted nucleic acid-binding protein